MSPHRIMPPPDDNPPFVPPARTARGPGSYERPFSPDGLIYRIRAEEFDLARYHPPLELEQMGFTPHDVDVLSALPMTLRDRVIEQLRVDREDAS